MKLYEHPLSPYARKVKIVLYEKGIPFERVSVTPLTIGDADPHYAEFSASSPRLEVPCLVDGDFRCFDSTIIADYLDDKWPDRPMLSGSPEVRASARMIEELSDSVLEAINWGMMELRFFKRAEGEEADRMLAAAKEQLGRIWDRLERELAKAPWLSGERFGRADAAVIIHVANATFFGMPPLERHAKLAEWTQRCLAIESVRRDQTDLAAFMSGDGLRSMRKGPFRRQYRDHRLEWMLKSGGVEVVLRGMKADTIRFSAFP